MTTIGQLLVDAREQKKMTVNEVAEITKIRSLYISALEEGRYSTFSSDVHLQGFLANYAKFLGLDIDRVHALYRRERRIKPEPMKSSMFTSKDRPKFVLTPKYIVLPLIAVAVIAVVVYFFRQYQIIAQPPVLSVTAPQDNTITATQNIAVNGQVEIGNTLTVNNQEVTTVDSLGFFEVYVKLNIEGANKITVVAESGLGKRSIIERTVTYQPTPVEQLSVQLQSISSRNIEYTVTRDSGVPETRTISPGGDLTLGAITEIVITTTNPSGLKVYANNQQLTLTPANNGTASATRIFYENGIVNAEPVQL